MPETMNSKEALQLLEKFAQAVYQINGPQHVHVQLQQVVESMKISLVKSEAEDKSKDKQKKMDNG